MTTRISDATRARIAQVWPDLLDQLAAGAVMGPIYTAAGLTADQVRVWRMELGAAGERENQWQSAREQSADAYADKVVEVANSPGSDSGIARVKMDAWRWLAGKRNPKAYSDRAQLDVNVRTVDLTRIIESANARLAASQAGRIIEGHVVRQALADLL